jgi:uridine kinase
MRPVILGLAGGTGSGKTTVVDGIVRVLGSEDVTVIQHDWYYRDRSHLGAAERERINYDHPDALETELMVAHLQVLLGGAGVDVPIYDFATHTRRPETRRVDPRRVLIVDGILVLAEPELRKLMNIRVFVDTDADLRLLRRIGRDIKQRGRTLDSVMRQYLDSTRPMHLEFVEPSKRHAHVIVPEGGMNEVAVDMLVTKIRSICAEQIGAPARSGQ